MPTFIWNDHPEIVSKSTKIVVSVDYDTTEDEIKQRLVDLEWQPLIWFRNHPNEYPLNVTFKGENILVIGKHFSRQITLDGLEKMRAKLADERAIIDALDVSPNGKRFGKDNFRVTYAKGRKHE